MTLPNLIEPYDPEAVEDYRQQSRIFLGRARGYLAADDLHQASEKGWGAAAWMAKAVAVRHGWEYESHPQFGTVIYQASELAANDRLRLLGASAYQLHRNYYIRGLFLISGAVARSLDDMAELLDALEPLTNPPDESASD